MLIFASILRIFAYHLFIFGTFGNVIGFPFILLQLWFNLP